MASVLVVGSLAYDSISTPEGSVDRILGGSANYFSVGASLFAPIRVVGVVGEDYSDEDLAKLKERGVDVAGLEKVSGKTFHWKGKYEGAMNEAQTLATDLNVFENFNPKLPDSYKDSDCVFLANIGPELQLKVLEQVEKPKLVALDTMNLWINTQKPALLKVLERSDILLINETEALDLTGQSNVVLASKEILTMGPKAVVIKRGEYGCFARSGDEIFAYPAYPLESVVDPTGAGDTFAGGFLGSMAREDLNMTFENIRKSCLYGSVLASFTVGGFGLSKLEQATIGSIDERLSKFRGIVR